MATDANTVSSRHIQLSNNSGECNRLYDFLDETLQQLPVTNEFRHDLKLVSEELLANIINHGYKKNATGTIDITISVDAQRARITFTDSGKAFNPLDNKDPDTLNNLSEGGMGLLLIRSLTDEQCYKRDNKLNVFTVTKNYNN